MSLHAPELSLLLCACAAAFPLLLSATAPAQEQPDKEVKALLARIDAARGQPEKQLPTLALTGTFTVACEGAPNGLPLDQGKYIEIFAGANRARHTGTMDEHGTIEFGALDDLAWEVNPMLGAKVQGKTAAVSVRRYLAMLRGASPSVLYREMAIARRQQLDGREHVVLRMTPPEGKADTWYVDSETARPSRIDIELPSPEDSVVVFGAPELVDAQVTFGDWRQVDGVYYPFHRATKMGPLTIDCVCSQVETGGRLERERFVPPAGVNELMQKSAAQTGAAAGAPLHQIVERQAQLVASIRVQCKREEMSATLAVVLPEVMAHLNATGAKMTGAPFSRYHGRNGDEIDFEAGIPVAKPITEKGRVKNSTLPAGKAVTMWHIGPYDKLPEVHKALHAYLAANHLRQRGGLWETYWTDPGMVPDSAKWRTQLFMPIE